MFVNSDLSHEHDTVKSIRRHIDIIGGDVCFPYKNYLLESKLLKKHATQQTIIFWVIAVLGRIQCPRKKLCAIPTDDASWMKKAVNMLKDIHPNHPEKNVRLI